MNAGEKKSAVRRQGYKKKIIFFLLVSDHHRFILPIYQLAKQLTTDAGELCYRGLFCALFAGNGGLLLGSGGGESP
jgi:hypothetical protein